MGTIWPFKTFTFLYLIGNNKLVYDMITSAYNVKLKLSLKLLEHVMVDRMASLGEIATNNSVHPQSRTRQISWKILFNDQLT